MARFKVNESVYIKHQGAIPWRIVQIDNPERGDDALYHLRDNRNTYEREFGRNLIGTDEPNASARASNSTLNEKVRIGDAELRGATTATLDFAKDRRGDYILAGDEVVADAGDGIDTYEVLKVLPGNKVKIGGLGVEVATVDAKTVSVARKHGILKRDGDTVVLKNAAGDVVLAEKNGYKLVKNPANGGYWIYLRNGDGYGIRALRDADAITEFNQMVSTAKNSIRSSNPVVANAIAAKCGNALISRYNPGDIVLYERRSPAVHTTVGGFMPGFREKTKIRLVAKRSGGLWDAKDDGGNKIVVDEADFMGKAQNAIAANFSARAKQEASKVMRDLDQAMGSLGMVVHELETSDDPNDKKHVEIVKKARKDIGAVFWKLQTVR